MSKQLNINLFLTLGLIIFLLFFFYKDPPILKDLFEINSNIIHFNYFTLRPYAILIQLYLVFIFLFNYKQLSNTYFIFLISFISLLILSLGNVNHPHGDEAHRLINAYSLGYDFDFDLTNNYQNEIFKYMVPDMHTISIDGKEHPVHWPSVAIYLFIPSFLSSLLKFDVIQFIGLIRVFDILIFSIGLVFIYKSLKLYFDKFLSLFFYFL